jgi:hypothetical protein
MENVSKQQAETILAGINLRDLEPVDRGSRYVALVGGVLLPVKDAYRCVLPGRDRQRTGRLPSDQSRIVLQETRVPGGRSHLAGVDLPLAV